ncbi:hypothetical protein DCC39_03290 [Pueribacillus theae]|uniref:DUF4367 domain-containing protein n=1 Tax=Pueribacillus theae TaxID=2171751 RepID=A0A2U1K7P6_9BACI|nr:hypothetical protein [Pueribacillus theae]PWA12908.1 hypothetical protein DCC39_03290 [Pueribacillus theae]
MKKLWLVILLIPALLVIGCSNESKESTTSKESSAQAENSEKEGKETKEKDNSAPLVDENNPLDERAMLEEAMNRQRDVLKLSFITDDYRSSRVNVGYYPLDDEFSYAASYMYPHLISSIFFEGGTTNLTSDNGHIDTSNGEKLDHNSLDALYGANESTSGGDTYYITGEDKNGASYIVTAEDSNQGYTNEMMKLMGKSMKTEEEGAYDPFYHMFSLDIDKLKFPKINKKRSDIYAAGIGVEEGSIGSHIGITYLTGDRDQISYSIQDKESLWVNDDLYEEVGEEKTPGGYSVIEYSDNGEDDRYFYWSDGEYYYELVVTASNDKTIATEDIYTIIDSAMSDDRAFATKTVFDAINEKPAFTENEKELNKLIEKLEDKN